MAGELPFDLIRRGDLAALRSALAADPALARSRQEPGGLSAVVFAMYHRQPAAAELLAAARSDLAWEEAVVLGDLARLEFLLARDPALARAVSGDGFTALHLACFFGRAALVSALLRAGADPDATASNGSDLRPLHSAAASRDLATLQALLAGRPSLDVRQQGGFTALHAAAQNGDLELARALLSAGADRSARADDGRDAAAIAREKGRAELAALFLPV